MVTGGWGDEGWPLEAGVRCWGEEGYVRAGHWRLGSGAGEWGEEVLGRGRREGSRGEGRIWWEGEGRDITHSCLQCV